MNPEPRPAYERPEVVYRLGHLERGTGKPYHEWLDRFYDLYTSPTLINRSHVAMDVTGVGDAVTEIFRGGGLPHKQIWITAGEKEHEERTELGHRIFIPKNNLIASLQVLFQNEQLDIHPSMPHAATLKQEITDFRVKTLPSGKDRFEHREGRHDDLLLAAAIAAWQARRYGGFADGCVLEGGPYSAPSAPVFACEAWSGW